MFLFIFVTGQVFIKVDKITEACLLILRDGRLRKAIGDAYLNLLYKHVLPTEHYLGFISPITWEGNAFSLVVSCR